MWDLPGLEIKLVSPALAGKFFTPGPPGKPSVSFSEIGLSVHGVGWQPMTHTPNIQFRLRSGLTSKLFPLYHSENITLLIIHRWILTYVPSQKNKQGSPGEVESWNRWDLDEKCLLAPVIQKERRGWTTGTAGVALYEGKRCRVVLSVGSSQWNRVSSPTMGTFTMQSYFLNDQRDVCCNSVYDSRKLKSM